MRIGALVLVGVGVFSVIVSACTANTSADMVCQSAGGVCITSTDLVGCAEQIEGAPCDTGYICCTPALDAGSSTPPATTADAAKGG